MEVPSSCHAQLLRFYVTSVKKVLSCSSSRGRMSYRTMLNETAVPTPLGWPEAQAVSTGRPGRFGEESWHGPCTWWKVSPGRHPVQGVAAGLQRGNQGHITTPGTGCAPQALSAVVKNVVRRRIVAENG